MFPISITVINDKVAIEITVLCIIPQVCVLDYLAIQVIEIVRKNVRVLCSTLLDAGVTTESIDNLKLYKMFQRVFSRMLWNGGRGLVDCLGPDRWYV